MNAKSMHALLFEMSSDGMLLHEFTTTASRGHFLAANDAVCQLLGYTAEELSHLTPFDIMAAEESQLVPQDAEAMRGRGTLIHEKQLVAKDGRLVPVEMSSRLFEDDGRTLALSIVRDITERKRLDEARHESERRLRLHVQSTPLAVVELDRQFRIIAWNPAAEAIFGWSAEEAIGRQANFIVPESARQHRDGVLSRLLERKGSEHGVNENVTKDGRIITCAWNNTSLVSSGGEVIGVAAMASDITVQRETEERFRIAFQTSPDAIAISRAVDGEYIAVNESFLRSLGWSEPEVIGRSSFDIHLWDDPGDRARLVESLKKDGHVENFEMRFRAKIGRIVAVLVSARLTTMSGESVLLSIARDITDWKSALDRIRESESRLRAFVESDVIGIFFGDVDGRVYDCNEALARIIGRNREDVLAGTVGRADITPPEDLRLDEAALAEAAETGRCKPYETRYLRPDGTVVPVQVGYVLLEPERRKSVAFVLDITKRKRAEEALRQSEAKFRSYIEQAPEALLVVDGEGRYIDCNPAALEMLGYDAAALFSKSILDVVLEDDHVAAMRDFAAFVPSGKLEGEYRFKRGDGRVVSVSLRAVRTADGGGMAFCQDVTKRKEAEARIKAMQAQLMQSDRLASVGMLAAGVAHEINNPLAYITAALAFLDEELKELARRSAGQSLGELQQALAEAREGAVRVKNVVRDLRTFSRVNEEDSATIELRPIIESSINMAFNEIKYRARLVKEYGKTPPVFANGGRLGQVFLNLLVNAAQALPEGRVDENEIRVTTRTDALGRAIVEVRDSGSGIPSDVIGRIFDPFFTTKPVGVGTGLGLSICHSIITALGGEISVESQEHEGTVFRVTLPPATPVKDDATAAPAAPVKQGRRGRVLVVDDEPSVGRSIQRLLRSEHEVLALTSAREALEVFARGERFDVIFCDLMMSEMTGMDLYKELKCMAPDQAERIVVLTGGGFTPSARQFLDTVPNLRIEKPFDSVNLRATVRSWVR